MDESRQVAAPVEPRAAGEVDGAPSPQAQAAASELPLSPDASAAVEPRAHDASGDAQADARVPEAEAGPVTPEAVPDASEAGAAEASPVEEAAPQVGHAADAVDADQPAGDQNGNDALAAESPPVAAVAEDAPQFPVEPDVFREAAWEAERAPSGASPAEAEPPEVEQTPAWAEVVPDPAVPPADEADAEPAAAMPEAPAQPEAEEAPPPEVAEADAADANLDAPDVAVDVAADEGSGPSVAEPAGLETLPVAPTPPAAPQAELREPEQRDAEGEAQLPDTPLPEPEPAWVSPPPAPTQAEAAALGAVPETQPIEAAPLPALRPPERALDAARTWQPSVASRGTVARALPYLRLAVRAAAALAVGYVVAVLVLIVLYRWVDPPMSALMLGQRLTGTPIERRWVPLERISSHLIRAVILSEDGGFCRHRGVDLTALGEAIESDRGGSTITMQVVKNLFLWPSRSYVRKAMEICLAYVVELVWPKRRILEIYLNIAEWGDGVFGAEAAARQHFLKSAARLTAEEAALLAVSLPNPLERMPASPSTTTRRLAGRLLTRMQVSQASLTCVRTLRPVKSGQGPLVPGPRLTL